MSALNKFGQPKTVIHVVAYKFRPTTSLNDQEKAIAGIKDMAAKIPGIKNIWLKTERNQIREFDGVYVIEFTNAEAAADYAESPIHDTWRKKWEQLRENSLSFQASIETRIFRNPQLTFASNAEPSAQNGIKESVRQNSLTERKPFRHRGDRVAGPWDAAIRWLSR